MIYVTGDTHGEYNEFLNRLKDKNLSKDDFVIVCGDFGFVWNDQYHRYFLAKLTAVPFTILFIDGNHEDFDLLGTYPVIEWHGGKVHKVANNIYHLMRGQLFDIEGKTFFTIGGAYSVDKSFRTEGKSWWKDELPSDEDYKTADHTLNNCNFKTDFVLTHTIPKTAVCMLGIAPDPHDAELTGYLDWLFEKLDFKAWFAGHFHINQTLWEKLHILYDDVEIAE